MKIGLVNVDKTSFPNLVLMKLSTYHKGKGDVVEFASMFESYDIIYKSKVFTFSEEDSYNYNASKIILGGTGYKNYSECLPKNIDNCIPDYSLYNCEHAYGFLTRGCPNKCPWCIVPTKEGNVAPYADIDNFIGSYRSAILMDNNVLASEHGVHQIEKIAKKGYAVDFNQGLDSKYIAEDPAIAKLLSKVKWLEAIRLACDKDSRIEQVRKAIENLRWHNCVPSRYFAYVLVDDDIESAVRRVKFLKGMYVDPFAQPYMDYDNPKSPTKEQADFCRWVNHRAVNKKSSWEEYVVIRKHEEATLPQDTLFS